MKPPNSGHLLPEMSAIGKNEYKHILCVCLCKIELYRLIKKKKNKEYDI